MHTMNLNFSKSNEKNILCGIYRVNFLDFVPLKKMIKRTDCRAYLKNKTKIETEVSIVWKRIWSM